MRAPCVGGAAIHNEARLTQALARASEAIVARGLIHQAEVMQRRLLFDVFTRTKRANLFVAVEQDADGFVCEFAKVIKRF